MVGNKACRRIGR